MRSSFSSKSILQFAGILFSEYPKVLAIEELAAYLLSMALKNSKTAYQDF